MDLYLTRRDIYTEVDSLVFQGQCHKGTADLSLILEEVHQLDICFGGFFLFCLKVVANPILLLIFHLLACICTVNVTLILTCRHRWAWWFQTWLLFQLARELSWTGDGCARITALAQGTPVSIELEAQRTEHSASMRGAWCCPCAVY